MIKKQNIKNYTKEKLTAELALIGQPAYRAEQIIKEIYVKRVENFEEMTLLNKDLRNLLTDKYELRYIGIKKIRKSTDGSVKFLFELIDGRSIEAVYMPWYDEDNGEIDRITLCISSMAGCPVDCAFCATGKLGFIRNLEAYEIIDQILLVEKELGKKIDNIVYMGMGEPLLNYKSVVDSIDILTDTSAKLLSRRKITLSTAGVVPKIIKLADETNPPKLAISLHATTNGFRSKLMPISKAHDISALMDAVEYYYRKTKMPITYEYIPFEGLNDTAEDALRLAKIGKRVPSRINIIPYNDISFTNPTGFAAELKPTSKEGIQEFANRVREHGVFPVVRDTFGEDIEAACGQLALSESK